ncbi:hypothetical protein SAMN05216228_100234 [Rhizobium tibeticum]|uniref:SAM-dependent methyltransferase n=1 Tax=Rhizobium tibeticum TaxID=501024 RepID=A0A1H8DF14_9HYPH|nr:SAM-dependent methyltransferase [Rhizobium tibeticum]SEH51572.1 hypothetical protein RTCCBAU85039_0855 [Rhizobium tibeticum]SEN05873.1 hypothetical protein SAMN05216228_100234 [Rhizobium tibeticum]
MADYPKLGPTQASLMQRALDPANDFSVVTGAERESKAARALNSKGFLSRDKVKADLWYSTEKARAVFNGWAYDPENAEAGDDVSVTISSGGASVETTVGELKALADVSTYDASGLVQVVERARALLDEGDAMAARLLASGAYDQAKAGAQFAARVGAKDRLVQKARRLQGEALLIEARATILIADEWDRAVSDGKTLKGRPKKSVPDENAFTAEEAGLSRKEIHEARKLAAAERREPGLVERAIRARIEAGLEPSRANLRVAVGTSTATKEERGHNLYETGPEAMHTLLALQKFSSKVSDPSCGRGAISKMMEAAGYTVIIADLVDYGTADRFGELQGVADFLESEGDPDQPDIVTNPPYGELLNRYVAHALRVHRPRKMALLLNLNFVCGFDDSERNFAMDDNPPARVLVFKRRLPMMHRDGWDGPEAQSRMNTAWFVWELQDDGSYGDTTIMRRVDWKDYMPAEGEEA